MRPGGVPACWWRSPRCCWPCTSTTHCPPPSCSAGPAGRTSRGQVAGSCITNIIKISETSCPAECWTVITVIHYSPGCHQSEICIHCIQANFSHFKRAFNSQISTLSLSDISRGQWGGWLTCGTWGRPWQFSPAARPSATPRWARGPPSPCSWEWPARSWPRWRPVGAPLSEAEICKLKAGIVIFLIN